MRYVEIEFFTQIFNITVLVMRDLLLDKIISICFDIEHDLNLINFVWKIFHTIQVKGQTYISLNGHQTGQILISRIIMYVVIMT